MIIGWDKSGASFGNYLFYNILAFLGSRTAKVDNCALRFGAGDLRGRGNRGHDNVSRYGKRPCYKGKSLSVVPFKLRSA